MQRDAVMSRYLITILLISILLVSCQPGDSPPENLFSTATPTLKATSGNQLVSPAPALQTLTPSQTPAVKVISRDNVDLLQQIGDSIPVGWIWIAKLIFQGDQVWVADAVSKTEIRIFDVITQEDIAILTDEGADIESIIVSQDGSLLAAVSPNKGKISLWELGSFEKIAEYPFEGYLTSMYHPVLYLEGKFSEDNGLLAIAACSLAVPPTFVFGNSECGSSDVIIYDTNTHKMETQISAVLTSTIHVSFNNEGTKLTIVGWGTDYLEIKIWGIEEKEFLVTLLGDENQYWDAQFDASGEQMFSSGSKYGYALLMWDTTTWKIKNSNFPSYRSNYCPNRKQLYINFTRYCKYFYNMGFG